MIEPGAAHDIGDYCWSARASKTGWLLADGRTIGSAASGATALASAAALALFTVLWDGHSQAALPIQTSTGAASTRGASAAADFAANKRLPLPGGVGRGLVAAGTGTLAEEFAAAAVTVATDLITVASNVDKWNTGMLVRVATTGTLPTGLASATDYFVIRISATTIKLASSLTNALAGTAVDITAQGTGTHTLTHTLTARAVGERGGEEMHLLTAAELAPHSHTIPSGGPATSAGAFQNFWQGPGPSTGTFTANSTNNGSPHNNMPPYLAANLFIYAGV